MIKPVIGLLVSYLLGSIPTAYLFAKLTKDIDLRHYGSGNLGATNAFRVLGKGIGTSVLLLDILKGAIAVCAARFIFYAENQDLSLNLYLCLASVAVVCGHNWSVFVGFKGGKGIATSLGALIAFSALVDRFVWVLASVVFLWFVLFLVFGLVSLASVVCSLALPLLAVFFRLPRDIILFLCALAVLSVFRHKSNIYRLLQRKESRFDTGNFLKKIFRETLSG